jgi:hypothetical protein
MYLTDEHHPISVRDDGYFFPDLGELKVFLKKDIFQLKNLKIKLIKILVPAKDAITR